MPLSSLTNDFIMLGLSPICNNVAFEEEALMAASMGRLSSKQTTEEYLQARKTADKYE